MVKVRWTYWLLFSFLSLSVVFAGNVDRSKVNKGVKEFQSQKWDEALNKFQDALLDDPENSVVHYNIGGVLYKKKRYEDALKSFEKALNTTDPLLQEKAYYNMGNVYYQMNKYQEAISSYKKALELDPNDMDAKHNLELVRAKLKEMAKKQQMSPQQQQQQGQSAQPRQANQQQGDKNQQQEQQRQDQEQKKQQSLANQDQQKDRKQNQEKQQEAQQVKPDEKKKELSKEEAERILQALKSKENQNKKMRPLPRMPRSKKVEKDW